MANKLFSGKSTRTKIFTVISAVAIVLIMALNVFVTSFGIFGNFYIDLTPEGLYTVRDVMFDVCDKIFYGEDGEALEPGVRITFCDDPDNLIADTYTRVVYYMALELDARYDNLEVETVNVRMDPTSVAAYKTTSLTEIKSSDVIISYGNRYRIASADTFWRIGSQKVHSYDGEYKLASILLSLTLVNKPVAYFVTDHGEDYYAPLDGITDEAQLNAQKEMNAETGYLYDLLTEKGLAVKTLSLSALIADAEAESAATGKHVYPAIPEDCVLLIINDPKVDFHEDPDKFGSYSYVSETELLDRYISKNVGSIMVAKDYKIELPVFESYLAEWGIEFSNTLVKDTENYIKDTSKELGTTLITDYITTEESYAYTVYGEYADLVTAPRVVIDDSGYIRSSYGDNSTGMNDPGDPDTSRIYAPFLMTGKTAIDYAMDPDGNYVRKAGDAGAKALCAVSGRKTIDSDTGNFTYSYIFCAASSSFFSSELLGNASYANYEVTAAMVQNIARLDTYAPDALGGISINNSESFLGKTLVDIAIRDSVVTETQTNADGSVSYVTKAGLTGGALVAFTVVIFAIPTAIAIVGIIVCIRRKYL